MNSPLKVAAELSLHIEIGLRLQRELQKTHPDVAAAIEQTRRTLAPQISAQRSHGRHFLEGKACFPLGVRVEGRAPCVDIAALQKEVQRVAGEICLRGDVDEISALKKMLQHAATPEQVVSTLASFIVSSEHKKAVAEESSRRRDVGLAALAECVKKVEAKLARDTEDVDEEEDPERRDAVFAELAGEFSREDRDNMSFLLSLANKLEESPLFKVIEAAPSADIIRALLEGIPAFRSIPSAVCDNWRKDRAFPLMAHMPPEKLMRFLRLQNCAGWYEEEVDQAAYTYNPDGISTTLSVVAEYFAEVDHQGTVIEERDIDAWVEAKLAAHDPDYYTTLYWCGRLMWSSFHAVAEKRLIPHLRKKLLSQGGARFKTSGESEKDYFALLAEAVQLLIAASQPTFQDIFEVFKLLPAAEYFPPAGKNDEEGAARSDSLEDLAEKIGVKIVEVAYGLDVEEILDLFIASDATPRYMLTDDDGWVSVFDEEVRLSGFGLFDADEVRRMMAFMYGNYVDVLLEVFENKVGGATDEQMRRLITAVQDGTLVLKGGNKEVMTSAVRDFYVDKAGAELFAGVEDSFVHEIIEMPDAASLRHIESLASFTSTVRGVIASGSSVSEIAERELLGRSLGATREGTGLISYLMKHRNAMRVSELVRPFPDAVNPLIIKECRDHPDLFALLQLTTLLEYLGFEPDAVVQEVLFHAKKACELHHPEMHPVGAEIENANYRGQLLTSRYGWLTNVMVAGSDWESSHEVTTARTYSPYLQSILIALIGDPRFKFINPDKLWSYQQQGIRASSIHVSLSMDKKLDRYEREIANTLRPLSNAIMLGFNTRPEFMHKHFLRHSGIASVGGLTLSEVGIFDSSWKYPHSLLDSQNTLSHRARFEETAGFFSPHGAHEGLIDAVWALGNAGTHHFQNHRAGGALVGGASSFSRMLSEMYEQFIREAARFIEEKKPLKAVTESERTEMAAALKKILLQHTENVKNEVRRSVVISSGQRRIITPIQGL